VLTLPTVGYFVVQNNKVQQYLVQKFSAKLSALFGSSITMESATIDLFCNYHFRNFLVRDLRNDTLLFSPELIIVPNAFTFTSRYVEISKIQLEQPKINLYIDSTNNINLQFIVNKLASKDTTKSAGWLLSFHNIEINKGHFTLKHAQNIPKEYGINFTDLDLNPLNIKVTGFRNTGDGVEIKIKDFNTIDKSGFTLSKLKARLKINRQNLVLNNLRLITPQSDIDADQVRVNFTKWKDLNAAGIFKKVKWNLIFNKSEISAVDLSYFVPKLKDYNLAIGLSGKIKGTINDLRGKNLEITYKKNTRFKGNININGLPDINNSFLHIDIQSLATNPSDIESIYLPALKYKHIVLPKNFSQFSYLKYKGKFTGFISDFVAYGTFSSNLGLIEGDVSVKPDTAQSVLFNGKIKMTQFQLGKYLSKEDKIGPISLNVLAKGNVYGTKNFFINIDGQVSSFIYNRYNYQNIKIDGELTNNTFNGNLAINDPNIDLGFTGNVDLTNTEPTFNFVANVKHANLYKLHIDDKDTSSAVSFYATANFEGDNIDNIKGEIKLWNSTLKRAGKEIQINDFLLFTQNVNDTNRLILRSNLADAEIWGNYKFKELAASFKALMKPYFPSLITGAVSDTATSNNFRFELDIKDTKQLADFIVPGFYISKDTKLTGNYNSKKRDLNFLLKIPLLQHLSKKWYNVYVNGKANRDSLSLISGCKNLKLTNQLNFENFTILSNFKKDSMNIALHWNNWDTIAYKGNFLIQGLISRKSPNNKPRFNFSVKPSQLVLKDTIWNVTAGSILADSTGFMVKQVELTHNQQKVKASGKLSNQKDDHLIVEFEKLDLGNLKTVYTPKKLSIDGIVNGKVQFSDIFTNPYIFAALTIDSLNINNQNIGATQIKANWDNSNKDIFIDASSTRGNLQTLRAVGRVFMDTRKLDFDINLNKLKLDLFEPFISGIFSNVRGIASGDLKLTGDLSAPLLNGEIKAQKATFVVNYLKTRYNFSQTISINNNSFLFDNTEIFDSKSNKAYVNGYIEFKKFKDLYLNLKIEANKFQCLNTTEKDNSLYYGVGYASGNITIKGMAPNINVDILATTNRNTEFFIPLLTKADVSESNFIRIVTKNKEEDPFAKYEIDKTEINTNTNTAAPSGLKLNLTLNVTPDANVQIVFDQKIGDLIQGNGNGSFSILYDAGRFNMFGVYTIEKGEYMFTLQNIINKKFEVTPGGTISWNGDPLDATVKLEGKYSVNASLYELLADEQYNKRIPIDCKLWLTDKLMNPTIQYDIYLPKSDPTTRTIVENAINNDEERSKQFLSLLILNSFMPNQDLLKNQQSNTGINAAGVTGVEFFSNQISHWLSQISKDFDVGINYHPGDEVTNQEVEVALSTQLLNDRITLNGNVDVGVDNQNNQNKTTTDKTNNIVGDFNLEYKITENGKLKFKVFNRSNDSYFDKLSSPYTQGVGIFYKEDFNSFKELMNKYYQTIFVRKKAENSDLKENSKTNNRTDLWDKEISKNEGSTN
jgi:hypothetical protein